MPGQGDTGKAAGTGVGGRPPESLGTPQCLEGACDRQGDSQALAIGFSRSKSAGCPVLFCTFLRGFLPLLLQHELVVAFLVCSIVPVHKLVLVLKGFLCFAVTPLFCGRTWRWGDSPGGRFVHHSLAILCFVSLRAQAR